jgi:hypothetical protein
MNHYGINNTIIRAENPKTIFNAVYWLVVTWKDGTEESRIAQGDNQASTFIKSTANV